MKKNGMFCLLLLSFFFCGCSNYQYYAIQSNNISFSKYRTFAWLPTADTGSFRNDIADEKIKDQVTASLEKRGLSLKINKPDLLVRYTVQVKELTKTYNSPSYVYQPGFGYTGVARNRYGRYFYYHYTNPFPVYVGNDVDQVPYKQGTLIIDLVERKSHKVIWRGYGVGDVDNPEKAIREIPEIVEGIFNKLNIKAITP